MSIYDIINQLTVMWQSAQGDRKAQQILARCANDLMRHWRIGRYERVRR